ncbi:hypothetical protein LXL04_003028 [Taraxacum kok-saghyz]
MRDVRNTEGENFDIRSNMNFSGQPFHPVARNSKLSPIMGHPLGLHLDFILVLHISINWFHCPVPMSPPTDTPVVVTRAQASRADLQDVRIDYLSNQMNDISKSLLSMQDLLAKLPLTVEKSGSQCRYWEETRRSRP